MSRLRSEDGQAVIEFALVLPLLVAFILLVADMGRLFNAYNDLNQMAADGARRAAVGNFTTPAAFRDANADTGVTRSATVSVPTYSGGTCKVGDTVTITAVVPSYSVLSSVPLAGVLGANVTLTGKSEMRVERCPTS